MKQHTAFQHHRSSPRARCEAPPFRLSPIAALIAGMSMIASGALYAADPSVAELQAEIARLKQLIAAQTAPLPVLPPATATATATASAAPEQEESHTLGEVTVRSRNRLERLQDVPLSVSVVTGKELERLAATDIKALTQRAANVSYNQGNQRTASLSIRGIGKQGQTEAQDPSVGLIVDGVNYSYNALSSSYDFTDVDAVEVTRGPQGTLLGKNTSVGVINVSTKRPSFTPDASYSLIFGQLDTVIGRLAVGGPVFDDLLAYRLTLSADKAKGDIRNLYNTDNTYSNKDRLSGRLQFLFTPTREFSARIAVDAQPRAGEATNGRTINTPTPATFSNGSVNSLSTDPAVRLARSWFTQQQGYSYQNTFLNGAGLNAVAYNSETPLVTGSHGASVELNWDLGSHNLTSITAYKDYHFNAVNDEGTPFDVNRNSGGFFNDYKQASEELRVSSKPGGKVDYQAGLFLMDVHNKANYQKGWGSDGGAWFASPAQYNRLNVNAVGRNLLLNSLDGLSMNFNSPAGVQAIENKSAAIFAQANWHLSEPLTLTTGLRATHENRNNLGSSGITDNGFAPELNPAAVNGVVLGGFSSNSAGVLGAGNTAAQLSVADSVANKYFGSAITGVAGAAYNSLSAAQKVQIADAKAIRAAQIGVVFNDTQAEAYKGTLPAFVLSPSYKFDANTTAYASWQYGAKAGIAQLTNGVSNLVRAEKTNALELGVKTALLGRTLLINADLFLMNIKDYQQAVRVLDVYTTKLNGDGTNYYTTATGNVPKVQAKGLEVDGAYSGITNVTLRFAGAYTDASYKDFANSAQPVENGYAGAAPYQDVTGQALPGAAKYTLNVGADYRRPVLGNKEFHASINTAYASRSNSDVSLSSYGWVPAAAVSDLAIGLGTRSQSFDVSLLVKNLFNNDAPQLRTWNTYTPATPRWIGVMVSGKI